MKLHPVYGKPFHISARGGLKSYLSSWKSDKSDSTVSPQGFHALSRRLQLRSYKSAESK